MSEPTQETAAAVDPAANGPSNWAALVLGADVDAASALIAGLSVPRRRCSTVALQALHEPLEGPDVTLDDELELRLRVAFPQADDEVSAPAHSWTPVDLLAFEADPPSPPAIGGLVYPGLRHVFSGEPETLKTWTALALEAEEVKAGRSVLHIDFEMGQRAMLERLRGLGVTDEEIARHFIYVFPSEPMTPPAVLADLDSLLKTRQPSFVVFDAFTGALEIHGFEPNSGVEVERFYRSVVRPFQAHGAAVVLLDHVTKNKESRGKFSIASERKLGGADVHLGFELVRPFGRGKSGLAKIVTHKDRPGHLPRPKAAELELTSDPDTGLVTWAIRPAEPADEEHPFRPTVLMARVSRYIAACMEPPSRNLVEEHVSGRREYVRQALELLIAEGYVHEEGGPRNARLLHSVKPFDEDNDGTV